MLAVKLHSVSKINQAINPSVN